MPPNVDIPPPPAFTSVDLPFPYGYSQNPYVREVSAKDGTDGSDLEERQAKLHSIHTEEVVKDDGDHVYRAVFGKNDELEWFET